MIEVPREIYHVEGCDCTGGSELHSLDCSLWQLPPEAAQAAVDAAAQRLADHTAELNRQLHAVLRQFGGDS